MTKEELEKEAEEYADTKVKDRKGYNARWELVRNAYLASAEPREKQIDELKAQTKVLEQNLEDTEICENGLKNRIVDLEAQIEKVKHYLDYDIPHDLINEATTKIWRMLK